MYNNETIIGELILKIVMNLIDALKELLNTFNQKEKHKSRGMKRVFQWRRYLDWDDLSHQEKISAKRILFVPIFAYLIINFFNQNLLAIIIIVSGYILYKKHEKGKLMK